MTEHSRRHGDDFPGCDFCSRTTDEVDIVATWATDTPTTRGGDDGTVYDLTDWNVCTECDQIVAMGDVDALIAHVEATDMFERVLDMRRLKLNIPEHAMRGAENALRREMLSVYRELFEKGMYRTPPLEDPLAVWPEPKPIPIDTEPNDGRGPRWQAAMDEQMHLVRFLSSSLGRNVLMAWADRETERSPEKKRVFSYLTAAEQPKLLGASPVWVSDEFCDLIDHARVTFKPETIMPEDVLIPQAFVYFNRPIYIHDRHGKEVNVKAISWCPTFAQAGTDPRGPEGDQHGIAIAFYSSRLADPERDEWVPDSQKMIAAYEARGVDRSNFPELTWLHLAPVWFGITPEGEEWDADHPGEKTGFEEWWSLLQVTMRLMLERIASKTQRVPDRHTRKRAARQKFDPRNVILIRLRRPRAHGNTDEGMCATGREYSHRFNVVGHWRNQWYPSLDRHRQRWISEYIKGPDDKPLVIKQRVYQWDR